MGGVTLVLRVSVEAAIVAALTYWGYRTGSTPATKSLLALGAPAIGFGFWGAVDFHQAGRFGEPLRLAQELAVSGLAAVGLYRAGHVGLAWALAGLSVGYYAVVYLRGNTLLKTQDQRKRLPGWSATDSALRSPTHRKGENR